MLHCSWWRNSLHSALVNSSYEELLHLKYKDQVYYPLASVCCSFVRWPTKAVAVRLRLLHRSHLKIGYFCDQWLLQLPTFRDSPFSFCWLLFYGHCDWKTASQMSQGWFRRWCYSSWSWSHPQENPKTMKIRLRPSQSMRWMMNDINIFSSAHIHSRPRSPSFPGRLQSRVALGTRMTHL